MSQHKQQASKVRLDRMALIAALREWQPEVFSLDDLGRIIEQAVKTDEQRTSAEQNMINEQAVRQLSRQLRLKLLPAAKLIRRRGHRNSDANRIAQWWRTIELLQGEIGAEENRRRQNHYTPEASVQGEYDQQIAVQPRQEVEIEPAEMERTSVSQSTAPLRRGKQRRTKIAVQQRRLLLIFDEDQ